MGFKAVDRYLDKLYKGERVQSMIGLKGILGLCGFGRPENLGTKPV